ncbi:MAG: substrate-binding domain-containing protein [Clostridia bacterium]|nr:substrate-binding domain-containing protein [Clostridia bacterium]
MKLLKQILSLFLVVLIFALYNLSIYALLTRRLANNFGGANSAKMVDVGAYLPHTDSPNLPHIDSGLKLTDDLPVLDGAAALVPVYAAIIDNVYPAGCVTFEGGKFSDDNFYGENFAPDSKMQYKNTLRGYTAIVDGDTDIFFSAAPSAEQKAYAEEKGVTLCYVPVGLEAFIFFVNSKNPVDNLTADQVRKIYSGEYTNWSQVGGPNRIINPVTRLKGSGSQTTMEKFMGDVPFGRKSPFAIAGGSIGYSFRYYFETMVGNRSVKMLSLSGVYPSAENIKNGSYPVVAQFFAIYREDNTNPNLQPLIDWILSAQGQEIIEKTGYVPIN